MAKIKEAAKQKINETEENPIEKTVENEVEQAVKETIAKMTLEEKAGMCSGGDFWHLKEVKRLGIPRIMVADGPHGLRKQEEEGDHLGINDSIQAVCFPAAAGLAASFHRALLRRVGETLGEECQAEQVSVLLGPAVNIKRSPLCGRNFEYMSEDPYVAGELASAYIQGVQAKGVGTSIKHFAVNNQERRRSTVSAQVSERALREIYLAGFEHAVKHGKPWTVMCSYNRVNGEYVSQSRRLLTEILRREWGFDGMLMTDWGACDDRVKGLLAGQDLEMPDSGGATDQQIVKAVEEGSLDETVLDETVCRILKLIYRWHKGKSYGTEFDRERDHGVAREAARESMVLLKNEAVQGRKLLPLKKGGRYAFIGGFAQNPRYQGGGSSHIRPYRVSNALEESQKYGEILYEEGYSLDGSWDPAKEEEQIKKAVNAAVSCDAAIIFAGLPEAMESEAYDREHMELPREQNRLIVEITKAQPNTAVVLHNGSPVEMPWILEVPAVLESYLAGEAVGEAQADLLFGEFSPSGKLAETFPLRLCDNPAWLDFGGEKDIVHYGEGIFVGYRYYDKKRMEVLFPFGHGLSYTEFEYKNLRLDRQRMKGEEPLLVSLDVKNTGAMDGAEIVQIYTAKKDGKISRPKKELKGFAKTFLKAGEEKRVEITLDSSSFRYFDEETNRWEIEPAEYWILAGASSRDIRLRETVVREDIWRGEKLCHRNTTLGDILADPVLAQTYREFMEQEMGKSVLDRAKQEQNAASGMERMLQAIIKDTPLRALRSFYKGKADDAFIKRLVDKLNGARNNQR